MQASAYLGELGGLSAHRAPARDGPAPKGRAVVPGGVRGAAGRHGPRLFPNAEPAVQSGAGHFPWLDDPDRFVATVATFLAPFGQAARPPPKQARLHRARHPLSDEQRRIPGQ